MYILIEEREKYDCSYNSTIYERENIGISDSLGDILQYCKDNYTLSEYHVVDLYKYNCVDDVLDKYRCSVNLIINKIDFIEDK